MLKNGTATSVELVNAYLARSVRLPPRAAFPCARIDYPLSRAENLFAIATNDLSPQGSNETITLDSIYDRSLRWRRMTHSSLSLQVNPISSLCSIGADFFQGLDDERSRGMVRGPLHGIPILVKDNVATAVELGMNTTAGSFALLGSAVPRDAHIVARLRAAGAIILGKANLSEWATFRGGNTNGWSARGQQTSSAYVRLPSRILIVLPSVPPRPSGHLAHSTIRPFARLTFVAGRGRLCRWRRPLWVIFRLRRGRLGRVRPILDRNGNGRVSLYPPSLPQADMLRRRRIDHLPW